MVYLAVFCVMLHFVLATKLLIMLRHNILSNQRPIDVFRSHVKRPKLYKTLIAFGAFGLSLGLEDFSNLLNKKSYKSRLLFYILISIPAMLSATAICILYIADNQLDVLGKEPMVIALISVIGVSIYLVVQDKTTS